MYCIHVLHPCTAYVYMGRGFCASLVALCGVCCTAGLCGAPVASCLHGVPRANWNVVCRLTRGMSQGECHVACCMAYYMATATWHVACSMAYYMATATWHDAWRMLHVSIAFMQCRCAQRTPRISRSAQVRRKTAGWLQSAIHTTMLADESCMRTTSRDRTAQPGPSYFVRTPAGARSHRQTHVRAHWSAGGLPVWPRGAQ